MSEDFYYTSLGFKQFGICGKYLFFTKNNISKKIKNEAYAIVFEYDYIESKLSL